MNPRRGGAIALLTLAGLGACREAATPADPPTLLFDDAPNILSVAHGAVVTHRTGENALDTSAIMAVDGDPRTVWVTPPGDPEEAMTVALAAPAEIARLGILMAGIRRNQAPAAVRFEGSSDGSTFVGLAEIPVREQGETWIDVEPARVSHLRISTPGALAGGARQVRLTDARAAGPFLHQPRPGPIDGTWRINGVPARFSSSGSAVRGVVAQPVPVSLEGGWEGTVVRMAWVRGKEFGVLAGSVDPGGRHLNGVLWHVDTRRAFFDETWFGERAEAEVSHQGNDPMPRFFDVEGRYPLYALAFDGSRLAAGTEPAVERLAALLARNAPGRFRLVAHHLGADTEAEDLRIAGERIESLRSALTAAGLDARRVEFVAAGRRDLLNQYELPWAPLQARLNNRIDLELVRDPRDPRSNGG